MMDKWLSGFFQYSIPVEMILGIDVNEIDYIFILIAYVVAGVIKGVTGLGFSTSCLPIMALHLDLKLAIPLVIVPSIVSNVVIMVQAGHFTEVIRRFWPLYISLIPGILIGLALLVSINVNVAKIILGFVLVIYALISLSNSSLSISEVWGQRLRIPVGFLTGFINGLTGSQVMPVLPYLFSLKLNKNTFIQAINISFTLSSFVMLAGMNQFGYLASHTFLIAVGGAIPVLAIVYFSGTLRNRIPGVLYQKLVLIFLLLLGLILSVKSIFVQF